MKNWLATKFAAWLSHETQPADIPLSDFERLRAEIRPCDVLLVEGRTRISRIIKTVTQSSWTHSALYIGRIAEIRDATVREWVRRHHAGGEDEQLLIEALLGRGTIVVPLRKYARDHVRICRPSGLTPRDAGQVIEYAARHLGTDYDMRQLIDLARFIYPWSIVPRRWRSTLFEYQAGIPTRTVCSSMLAAAFATVHYPILPVVRRDADGKLRFYKRNTKLYTPRDFDYSPYFDIIKYPVLGGFDDLAVYRQLPWNEDGVICNGLNDCYVPGAPPAQESGADAPPQSPPSLARAVSGGPRKE